MHRSEETGTRADLPEPVDDDAPGDGRQELGQGVGPMLHRSYAVRIVHSSMSPAALIETAPEGYEAWCRAAMARLQLVPLGAAEIDRCLATARSAGEELRRSTLASPDGSPDGALGVASSAA